MDISGGGTKYFTYYTTPFREEADLNLSSHQIDLDRGLEATQFNSLLL